MRTPAPADASCAGGPAIRVAGQFHYWIGYQIDPVMAAQARATDDERYRCDCPGTPRSGMTRCPLRATAEDGLCEACRASDGHGAP